MPICNTDNFISQLQTKINTIAGDSCPWCQVSGVFCHTAAIKTDGTLWTWGAGGCGTLGNGTTVSRSSPGTVAGGGTNWCQVFVDYTRTAAVKTDGTLWTWGRNTQGSLGDGTLTNRCSPGTVAGGGTNWCQVSGAFAHIAAIKTDGTLWTWGCNVSGQLGDGTTVDRSSPGTVAGGGTTWCQVSGGAGGAHTTAIKTDGTIWTWGCNNQGQLGDGNSDKSSPGTIAGGGTTWCQVSGAYGHTTAIKTDGTLWTWGYNAFGGRLGDGTTVARNSPGTIAGAGTDWCQVCAGNFHTISSKTDGTLWTWGSNFVGQLGDGTTVSRCSPGTIAGGGTTWCQVSGGAYSSLAIKTDGTIWTWGTNAQGKLGDGTTVSRCSPGSVAIQPVASSEDFLLYAEAIAQVTDNRKVSVASSSSLPDPLGNGIPTGQMVFLEDRLIPVIANGHDWDGLDGRALVTGPKYCLFTWGRNLFGPLGDGTGTCRCSPGTVAGEGATWCQSSGGSGGGPFLTAIKTDGTLWTWGYNSCGTLGDGTTISKNSPGTIAGGGTTWCQVSAGFCHSAALKTNGTLWTWGRNTCGQLGNGTTLNRCSPGTIAGGGTTWCHISNGNYHASAIKTDGTLWTWGCNGCGILGDGTTVSRCSPGTTAGCGTNWCQVSGGGSHTAAIKTDGTLWTWGGNSGGTLGDGTTVSRSSPGTVWGSYTNWCQVSGGGAHTAAIKTDGTLWTWGQNASGQLGVGTAIVRCSPGTVAGGGTTWCRAFGGSTSHGAIKTDGTLWTWGYNGQGRLGDGTTLNRCSPGTVAGGGTKWYFAENSSSLMSAITRQ